MTSKPLQEITIAGRAFRVGTLTSEKHLAAMPDIQFFARLPRTVEAAHSEDAQRAFARMALLLLRDDAPDLTADWLSENMRGVEQNSMALEFQRQAMERAVAAGMAGRA
jgi:hypothetical protein